MASETWCEPRSGHTCEVESSNRDRAAVEVYDGMRRARQINTMVKAGIMGAFAIALLVPIGHLEGKGMGFRAPFFCGTALVVPLLQRVRPRRPYPHVADSLLVAPFLVDTIANLAGIYDNYAVTDDVLHAVNWVLLVLAFHAFRFRAVCDNRDAWLLGAGFGALAIVGWEIAEWVVAETGSAGNLGLTYGDTIGDLALSSAGGTIGSALGVWLFGWRRPWRERSPSQG